MNYVTVKLTEDQALRLLDLVDFEQRQWHGTASTSREYRAYLGRIKTKIRRALGYTQED